MYSLIVLGYMGYTVLFLAYDIHNTTKETLDRFNVKVEDIDIVSFCCCFHFI